MTFSGCPGSREMNLKRELADQSGGPRVESQLGQWPVQLHLVSPMAPYFEKADVLLSADCVAYAMGDFHRELLAGKSLAIACPKLDSGSDIYVDKLVAMIDEAIINSLTVAVMQVPCCSGLVQMAKTALAKSTRKVPAKVLVVGLEGSILRQSWL